MGKTDSSNSVLDVRIFHIDCYLSTLCVCVLCNIQRVVDPGRTIYDRPMVLSNAALQANTAISKMHCDMQGIILFKSPPRIRESVKTVDEEEKELSYNRHSSSTQALSTNTRKV